MTAVLTASEHSVAQQRALSERAFPQWLVNLPSGARVGVRQCGRRGWQQPSLVLLHGISSGAASWLHTALCLADKHHVLAWDAPGYGHSSPLEQPAPRAADYAVRLRETLDTLEVDRCIVVGHSLGALAACELAQLDPRRLAGLVLLSPARGYGADPDAAQRVRSERLSALKAEGVAGLAARIDQRLVSASASEKVRAWVRWNASRMTAGGYAQAVEMLVAGRLIAPPAGIPVQVHVGEADMVTTPASCEQAARALGASFRTIPGAGHASPAEQPAAVAGLLAAAAQEMQGGSQ
jgi:pimeloyl-ACP methyl ester carboxylesterase